MTDSILTSLEAAFQELPLPQLIIADNGSILSANAAAGQLFRCPAEDLKGQPLNQLLSLSQLPPVASSSSASLDELANREEGGWETSRAIQVDGTEIPVEVQARTIRTGTRDQLVYSMRRLSEPGALRAELLASEEKFHCFFHLPRVGMAQLDAHSGRFLQVNEHFCEITGYSREELESMTPAQLTHPDDQAADRETIARFFRQQLPEYFSEKRYVRKDGQPIWVQVNASLILDAGGEPSRTIAVIHEISERKATEIALRSREESLRQAMRLARLGIFEHDQVQDQLDFSPEMRKLSGWSAEHPVSLPEWLKLVHPDDRPGVAAAVAAAHDPQGPGLYDVEHRILREDGSTHWVRVKAQTFFEERDGKWQPLKTIGAAMDITEEREWRAGLENINEQLERKILQRTQQLETERKTALKMAQAAETAWHRAEENSQAFARANTELEQFAYVASHDLQEPLRKIQAFGNLLISAYQTQLDAQGQDYLQRMARAAGRMQTLINDLLSLSRIVRKGRPFKMVDLSCIVEEVLGDLESRISETGARIDIGLLPTLEADATQMRQLFQNLIGNALKYIRSGESPRITISASPVQPDEQDGPIKSLAPPAWRIEVQDHGIGFGEQDAERIFQPFQRLHGRNEFEGTGMGLAICRRIVERHEGTISATGEVGKGSQFLVILPTTHLMGEGGDGRTDQASDLSDG